MKNNNNDDTTNSAKQSHPRHKQRLGVLIAAAAGIVATFLPWIHAPIIGSVSGTQGDGWITLILFLPAVILCLSGDSTKPIKGGKRLGTVIPSLIASLIGAYKIADFKSIKSSMNEGMEDNPFAEMFASTVQIGIGLYLLIAAGVAVAVLAWALDKKHK
jgi:hypothetical protein